MNDSDLDDGYEVIPVSFWKKRGLVLDIFNNRVFIAPTISASKHVKAKGFKSLAQISRMVYVSAGRLNRMYKNEPDMFDAIIDGLIAQDKI